MASRSEDTAGDHTGHSGCRVLIVDDDPTIRAVLRATLAEAGYETVEAADGAEALLCLQRERFNVIVLDLDMPVMNGRAFSRRMREHGEAIPTLILSAHGAREAAEELGAAAALDKPFDVDEVAGTVARLCGMDGMVEDSERGNGLATQSPSSCA
jgi:CheY-like chemotaxis protein